MRFRMSCCALLWAALLCSPSAHANHCPQMMKQVDALLEAHPPLSPDVQAEVRKLRADGEALHNAGDHDASMAALAKAMRLINSNGARR